MSLLEIYLILFFCYPFQHRYILLNKECLPMKKSLFFMIISFIIFTMYITSIATIDKKEYVIPLHETAPIIDGDGTDPAWENAERITLSPQTCIATGGYAKFPEKSEGAIAELSIIWSNQFDKEGLYFKWDVIDQTQSFASDITSTQFNTMDCVQVIIDPLHKQYATTKNCAMCFTFVPYTSIAGNGFVPSQPATWWEHWIWGGTISNAGVLVCSKLKTDNSSFITGYIIEAFIPWKALNINGNQPKPEVGKSIGIGFSLIDYTYNNLSFSSEYLDKEQELINICFDFGNGKERINSPKHYNTAILSTEEGVVPENIKEPDLSESHEIAYQALLKELENAKSIYLQNQEYTATSLNSLFDCLSNAENMTSQNTITELMDARDQLAKAISLLVPVNRDELTAYIDKALKLEQNKYTPETWYVLQATLDDAINQIQSNNSDLTKVKDDLATALANLILAPTNDTLEKEKLLNELDNFIFSTKNYTEQDYTADTWIPFKSSLEYAKELLKKENVTTEQLSNCLYSIEQANSKLIKNNIQEKNTIGTITIILIASLLILLNTLLILYFKKFINSISVT